jgi:tetratricopeptide (TPR) repeat protein
MLQRALTLHRQGQLARARSVYEEILGVQPQHFDALHLSGVVAIQTNNPELALALIAKAIDVHPGNAAVHCNHGSALEALGRTDAALASFARAISINPDYLEAHFNRANVLHKLERYEPALAAYDRAIAINPNLADAHFNRGKVLRRLERWDEAGASFDRAIAIDPGHADAYLSRGLVLKEMRRPDAALASYERAIAIKPDYVEAHCNRGNLLKKLGRWDAALASYDKAVSIKADSAEAHFGRGIVLHELGRFDDALSSYDKAVAVRPDYAEAHSNRGNTLTEFNRLPEALSAYEQALSVNSHYAPAHFNKAIALLLAGEFSRGWPEYEWRWKNEDGSVIHERRELRQPLWLGGESPAGKSVLLYGEQGLGDTIQFCRYAKLVADLNAHVILQVNEPLLKLLACLDGVSRLVARDGELPHFDYQCPLLSLPLAFKTTLDNIPSARGYLSGNPAKTAYWRGRLGEAVKPRIGLAWSGNPNQKNDRKRSVPLTQLISRLPGNVQYVCLQTEVRESDRRALLAHPEILNFGDELDFENTAALCECLDLVISVDTSVAHLSAALGKTTWILLPFNPDWRWLLNRTDCPWYRAATLYRQQTTGDWNGALERMASDLRGYLNL